MSCQAERPAEQDRIAAYVARTVARLADTPLTPAQQDVVRAAFSTARVYPAPAGER